jgi:hypothetical protein
MVEEDGWANWPALLHQPLELSCAFFKADILTNA